MQVLYFLESLRNPVTDVIFAAVTYLGDEAAFLAAALVLYWCVDKTAAYYLAAIGFSGTALNQTLKMMFRVPRPWDLDPAFTIVESARAAATGYSFPSGHTQNAVGIWGGLAMARRERWVRILCIVAVLAVPFSRMYLGVHTPMDVGVSTVLAVTLVFLYYPLYRRTQGSLGALLGLLTPSVLLCIAALVLLSLLSVPADALSYLHEANENLCKLLGASLAMLASAIVDRRWLHFETRAPWYVQILKAVLGVALVLGLKAALKPLFALFLPVGIADFLRYFLTVCAAGILWPMTFPYFAKMQNKKNEE